MPATLHESHETTDTLSSTAHTPEPARHAPAPAHTHEHAPIPAEVLHLSGTLRLRDGAVVGVRALRPDDRTRLQALHSRLSPDTIVFRFFRALPRLNDETAQHLSHLDYDGRMALAATLPEGDGDDERLIAVVRYERIGPETAEVAFVVEDDWQGRGIATALLLLLAPYARTRGFTSLVAITMAANARMLDVLHHCGYPITAHYDAGDIHVALDITAVPAPDFTLDYTPSDLAR